MHQNLKTTFSLDLENQWQTLIASKSYGTFFTLHGKFKYKTGTKEPINCDLYIQNFSGLITIGIDHVNTQIKLIHDPLMGKPCFVMYVTLKALHANDTVYNKEVQLFNNLSGHLSANEFSKEYNLKIEILYSKLNGFNKDDLKSSTIVDLNYKRDGESLLKNTFSEPLNEDTKTQLYKNYFNSNDDVTILEEQELAFDGRKTMRTRNFQEETIDKIKLSNGDIHDVIKPYPCYLSYVQFV
ncbi:hypothetical protein [Polaribacter glomeratus]|uniref:Uncharacterized protein n=1 Tax=Polaribacter glomeratus TaxID=102 RepID=A0A2S7WVL8_9FLAO|nr:hypothetical protein [Polaribacter glomeratus]PQJ81635.1 hypothetical protein BTO16_03205 [Polaribacter glomeratus]TXD66441.1 hypothetical protein ESX12_06570 [Polaribacter glomeratus]